MIRWKNFGEPGTCQARRREFVASEIENVLTYLARVTGQIPTLQLALGWLLANQARVQLVDRHAANQVLAMSFGAHRRIEIPMAPWMGYVRGVPVPDPLIWAEAAKEWPQNLISVQVATDDLYLSNLMRPLIRPHRDRLERQELERQMQSLRTDVDRALDLYSEIRHIMEATPERGGELSIFLQFAEQDMQGLGRQLQRFKEQLEESPRTE